VVKKIWHFIGLPDPEENIDKKKNLKIKKKAVQEEKIETQKQTIIEKTAQKNLPLGVHNWDGPRTPTGEPFHDLGINHLPKNKFIPNRALRYVTPDSMNRLPIDSMSNRLFQGDVVVVDLSTMVHMESQKRACRQSLRQLSNERRIPIFSLDSKDNLLMLPGKNIHVDISKYDLL
tara:strand:+ start:473 stop:997 length:525 start_codon:yes stop_codon:yes gene_type:complete